MKKVAALLAVLALAVLALRTGGEDGIRERPVVTRELPPGTRIAGLGTDFRMERVLASHIAEGAIVRGDALVGRVLLKRKRVGQPVFESDLAPVGTPPGPAGLISANKLAAGTQAVAFTLAELHIDHPRLFEDGDRATIFAVPERGGNGEMKGETIVLGALVLVAPTGEGELTLALPPTERRKITAYLEKGYVLFATLAGTTPGDSPPARASPEALWPLDDRVRPGERGYKPTYPPR